MILHTVKSLLFHMLLKGLARRLTENPSDILEACEGLLLTVIDLAISEFAFDLISPI